MSEVNKDIEELKTSVAEVAEKVQLIGEMCAQLKKILVEIAEEQKRCREELAEASGTIAESSWF